jgi:prevent-host-death family protein
VVVSGHYCRSPGLVDQLDQLEPSRYPAVVAKTLNLYQAKTQLSALVEEAAAGAEIVIAKAGKPMAKLVPIRPANRRRPGLGKGTVWMASDFDAPLPKGVLEAFEGRPVRRR